MESTLLSNVKAYFTDEVINKLGVNLNESPETIRKGLDLSIPSLLLGLQGKSQEGLSSILISAKHLFGSFDFEHIFGNYFGSPAGTDNSKFETQNLLSSIFGDRLNNIVESIASSLGVRSETVSGLFGASLPAVISAITSKGSIWDPSSIGSLLNVNKSSFASALPTSLGLGTFGSLFAQADNPTELANEPSLTKAIDPVVPLPKRDPIHTPERVEEEKRGAGWWWILIPLILIAIWFLFGRGGSDDQKDSVLMDSTAMRDTVMGIPESTTPNDRDFVDVATPDGNTLKAYPGGIEENLIAFLQSDYKALSDDELKEKWFDFDNLNFETGTANVLPESQQQLENLAVILKLFPDAKIKIGGYTDKTGNENLNKRISEERAEAVEKYLSDHGLGGQVVDAEGYGSEYATVAIDASDTERAKDRRVAVSVRK